MRRASPALSLLLLAGCGGGGGERPDARATATPTPRPVSVALYLEQGEVGYRGRPLAYGRAEGVRSRRVSIEADRYPFGDGFRRVETLRVRRQQFRARVRPTANTRYRARAVGARAVSEAVPAFVYPKTEFDLVRTPGNSLQATFSVRGPRDFRARARTVHFYRSTDEPGTFRRVAGSKLARTGPGRARARVVVPDSGSSKTRYFGCVGAQLARGFGRATFGGPSGSEPDDCGNRRLVDYFIK